MEEFMFSKSKEAFFWTIVESSFNAATPEV